MPFGQYKSLLLSDRDTAHTREQLAHEPVAVPVQQRSQGPDFQKIFGKILSFAKVFPKFIESYKVKIFTEF